MGEGQELLVLGLGFGDNDDDVIENVQMILGLAALDVHGDALELQCAVRLHQCLGSATGDLHELLHLLGLLDVLVDVVRNALHQRQRTVKQAVVRVRGVGRCL